jgi:hypothetical protein
MLLCILHAKGVCNLVLARLLLTLLVTLQWSRLLTLQQQTRMNNAAQHALGASSLLVIIGDKAAAHTPCHTAAGTQLTLQ